MAINKSTVYSLQSTAKSRSQVRLGRSRKSEVGKPLTMEELLASQSSQKQLQTLHRGQEVEGEAVSITNKEVILDLGAKSEGVLSKRELSGDQLTNLKLGDRLKAYVYMPENENGQAVLSLSSTTHLERSSFGSARSGKFDKHFRFRGGKSVNWFRFLNAQNQKSKLQGKVLEVNKGGLIVEVMGVRGFLPNSQVGFELMSKAGQGMEGLIGQDLAVTVIEVDQNDNKLIFSQRGPVSPDVKAKLESFTGDQKVNGKIVAILPFGLVVNVGGTEGLVFISDVSWDRVDDLSKIFIIGEDLEVKVMGADLELGRLNLSIKQLSKDPFAKLAEKFPVDEVVKGEITGISGSGLSVELSDGIEGFLPTSKISGESNYQVGKNATFLVDGVDMRKRRINLAPFVTSTEGLIYK